MIGTSGIQGTVPGRYGLRPKRAQFKPAAKKKTPETVRAYNPDAQGGTALGRAEPLSRGAGSMGQARPVGTTSQRFQATGPVGQGTASVSSPAPSPAGPSAQAPPFDPAYESQISQGQQRYGNTIADIAYRRTATGYEWNDPSNPFNAAAMLKKAYTQRDAGIGNSYAAAGQLYSGATQRNLDESRFSYEQSYDQGSRAFDLAMNNLSREEAEALLTREDAAGEAYREWLDRAPRPDDPGPPASSPPPGDSGKSKDKPKYTGASGLGNARPVGRPQRGFQPSVGQGRARVEVGRGNARVGGKKTKKKGARYG